MPTAFTLIRIFSRAPRPGKVFRLAAAIVFAAGWMASPLPAQETAPPALTALQSRTELVKLDVSVLDEHGEFAVGLEQKDFRVLDNGVEQPIIFSRLWKLRLKFWC